eukprot:SAG31_NODE_300_length_18109_cov_47.887285_17_plen_73_part_00
MSSVAKSKHWAPALSVWYIGRMNSHCNGRRRVEMHRRLTMQECICNSRRRNCVKKQPRATLQLSIRTPMENH